MHRFTKIVATLGPASSDLATLTRLVEAGVDVVRLNFSHGKADDHRARVETLAVAAARAGRTVGVMADLQGPKIRVGKFADNKVMLKGGQAFIFDIECTLGDAGRVGLDYPELVNDVEPGAVLLLDDGRIVMDVKSVNATQIHCTVRHGGELSNNKGINRQGGGLTAPALTLKDMEDIKIAASLNVDYVAVSFPKNGADMRQARELLRAAGSNALLIAKIERVEAFPALEEILDASDGAMVARGDLAV
ncbi:MAG: pyruvate kinase, partial [Methyloversatilis sp.]|nr:pyruvate kinase [Methyloversatilis sp.]